VSAPQGAQVIISNKHLIKPWGVFRLRISFSEETNPTYRNLPFLSFRPEWRNQLRWCGRGCDGDGHEDELR